MDAEFPCVPISLNHLRLACEIVILAVGHVAIADVRLEVALVLDPVRWIQEHTLNLAREAFTVKQAGHDGEGVTEDHSVRPVEIVLVELDGFVWLQRSDVKQGLLEPLSTNLTNNLMC